MENTSEGPKLRLVKKNVYKKKGFIKHLSAIRYKRKRHGKIKIKLKRVMPVRFKYEY